MKIAGIYSITSPSGKVYIGQSWDVRKRWSHYHCNCESQPMLRNSFQKYGVSAHQFAFIWPCHHVPDQAFLDNEEITFIKRYREDGKILLNVKEGGSTGKHSESTKALMSRQRKGKPKSASFKLKLSQRQLGVPRGVGENNCKAILNSAQVLEIRAKFIPFKYTKKMLAKEYGVSCPAIDRILNRTNWKHI